MSLLNKRYFLKMHENVSIWLLYFTQSVHKEAQRRMNELQFEDVCSELKDQFDAAEKQLHLERQALKADQPLQKVLQQHQVTSWSEY